MITLSLTPQEAQYIFRACNFLMADYAEKIGNPIPEEKREPIKLLNGIKEKINIEAVKVKIDITKDIK